MPELLSIGKLFTQAWEFRLNSIERVFSLASEIKHIYRKTSWEAVSEFGGYNKTLNPTY